MTTETSATAASPGPGELRHSLRTPLNHIVGYTELLLEECDPACRGAAEPHLQLIHAEALAILEAVQIRLGPNLTSIDEAVNGLRGDIEDKVRAIVRSAGALVQIVDAPAVPTVLRISTAAADLLAFTQGQQFAAPVAPRASVPQPSPDPQKGTVPAAVLVVDDDDGNRDILCRQLERIGMEAISAEDGVDALARMAERPFDLVLLDVRMPNVDGMEVLKRMKGDERLRNIPAIMITASDELASTAYCIEQGAEDYLLKPFEPVLLRARLNGALERKRMRDLERKRTEELERLSSQLLRSNEDLNQFAYAVSHDLQTPLRTITSYAQLLQRRLRGRLSEEEQGLFDFVIDGAKRMHELVRDLLVYSQVSIDSRRIEPVECNELVDEITGDLAAMIEENQAVVVRGDLPRVDADRVQLRQVFQNLISNAIKYRSSAPPEVRITAVREGTEWHVLVSDNGVGFDPRYAQLIFQMFQRLHGPECPGTGIGLAICKRVVQSLGGRIWAESQDGAGSVFHFTIPA